MNFLIKIGFLNTLSSKYPRPEGLGRETATGEDYPIMYNDVDIFCFSVEI